MNHPEDKLAIAVADFLRVAAPDTIWWHTPNEATLPKKKNKAGKWYSPEGARRKAMGVRPGVPDLILINRDGRPSFIELKAPKKYQSPEQKKFQQDVERMNLRYAVCRSVDEVQATLKCWSVQMRVAT